MDEDNGWREHLSVEQRASNVFTNVKDLPDLFNQFQHAQSALGSSLRIPSQEASAGDQDAFYTKVMEKVPGLVRKPVADDDESHDQFWMTMGRPEKSEDYAAVEGLSPDQTSFMRDAALASNMTKEQFHSFANKFAGQATEHSESVKLEATTALSEFKNELGLAFDTRMTAMKLLAVNLGMSDKLQEAITAEVPNVDVLRLMNTLVDKIGSEGGAIQEQIGENASSIMTPHEAEARLSEIDGNRTHAFWNSEDSGHQAAKQQYVQLVAYANAGKSNKGPLSSFLG